jgi:hypothetical protein
MITLPFTPVEYENYIGETMPEPNQMYFDLVWFMFKRICPCLTVDSVSTLSDEQKQLLWKAFMLQINYYSVNGQTIEDGKVLTNVMVGDYMEGYTKTGDTDKQRYLPMSIDMLKEVFPNCSYWTRFNVHRYNLYLWKGCK